MYMYCQYVKNKGSKNLNLSLPKTESSQMSLALGKSHFLYLVGRQLAWTLPIRPVITGWPFFQTLK